MTLETLRSFERATLEELVKTVLAARPTTGAAQTPPAADSLVGHARRTEPVAVPTLLSQHRQLPQLGQVYTACGSEVAVHTLIAEMVEAATAREAQQLTWREPSPSICEGDTWVLTPLDGAPEPFKGYVAEEHIVGAIWRVTHNGINQVSPTDG